MRIKDIHAVEPWLIFAGAVESMVAYEVDGAAAAPGCLMKIERYIRPVSASRASCRVVVGCIEYFVKQRLTFQPLNVFVCAALQPLSRRVAVLKISVPVVGTSFNPGPR